MSKGKTILLAIALLLVTLPAAAETCNSYGGVSPQHEVDFGYYCGGTGAGCTECYNFHPGGVFVCVFWQTWDRWCTDYGDEYQWI